MVSSQRVRATFGVLASLLALSGCASKSVELVERGVRPNLAASASVTVAATPDEAAQVGPLIQELRAAGLVAQAQPGAPYLMEVSYSERPVKVGAYSGPPPAMDAAQSGWIAAPRKPGLLPSLRRQICTMAVRIADVGQSGGAYELRAVKKGRGAGCGDAPATLSQAISARLASS